MKTLQQQRAKEDRIETSGKKSAQLKNLGGGRKRKGRDLRPIGKIKRTPGLGIISETVFQTKAEEERSRGRGGNPNLRPAKKGVGRNGNDILPS